MSVPAKWHHIPSNGFSRVHECDRHTDMQMDHAAGSSVATGGIIAFSDAAEKQQYNGVMNYLIRISTKLYILQPPLISFSRSVTYLASTVCVIHSA